MLVLITCYAIKNNPVVEDGETLFVCADAPGPFGIGEDVLQAHLGYEVSLVAVSPLPEDADPGFYFRTIDANGYAVLADSPPESPADEDCPDPIPYLDLSCSVDTPEAPSDAPEDPDHLTPDERGPAPGDPAHGGTLPHIPPAPGGRS